METIDDAIRLLNGEPSGFLILHQQGRSVGALISMKVVEEMAELQLRNGAKRSGPRPTRKQRREKADLRRQAEKMRPRSRSGNFKDELRSIGGRYV